MNNKYDRDDNRGLYDAFFELRNIQHSQLESNPKYKKKLKKEKNQKNEAQLNVSVPDNTEQLYTTNKVYTHDLKFFHIVIGFILLIIAILIFFPTTGAFSTSYALDLNYEEDISYEINRHSLNIQDIITSNSGLTVIKEQLTEDRSIDFNTTYTDIPTLPKGEETVTQEGLNGLDKFSLVKTYENGQFIEEIIYDREVITSPTERLINIGTSEFLFKHSVHLNDTMYLTNESTLKSEPNSSATTVAEIPQYLDVKLIDLPNEEWCKVSFDTVEGYLKTSTLTSAISTPSIIEKNRIQEILLKVNIDIPLNKPSGLTLDDYKEIFNNLPEDEYSIFKNNYTEFYYAEKNYNINGLALAAIAIHESSWGASEISSDTKNLFGYGSYDNAPVNSQIEFISYSEGIDSVAKDLVKYYINPFGTIIYSNERAMATFYNGSTLNGINKLYTTDSNWYFHVYNNLEYLYSKLR